MKRHAYLHVIAISSLGIFLTACSEMVSNDSATPVPAGAETSAPPLNAPPEISYDPQAAIAALEDLNPGTDPYARDYHNELVSQGFTNLEALRALDEFQLNPDDVSYWDPEVARDTEDMIRSWGGDPRSEALVHIQPTEDSRPYSMRRLYDELVFYGYSLHTVDYALLNVDLDWLDNAVRAAELAREENAGDPEKDNPNHIRQLLSYEYFEEPEIAYALKEVF